MSDLLQVPKPLEGFRAILADPPWGFVTRSREAKLPQRKASAQHYPTMSRAELRALPVRELAGADCALIMWVVDTHLLQAMELGMDWGFVFKTKVFTWLKTDAAGDRFPMGMGLWSRKQTEIALLFTRGAPPRLSGAVRELIIAPRREHSRKPDEQYDAVEALVGGPYLELFSRTHRPGWTSWGNEAGKFAAADEVAKPAGILAAKAG